MNFSTFQARFFAVAGFTVAPLLAGPFPQLYQNDFEHANPLAALVQVDYSGVNSASSPGVVSGNGSQVAIRVGGGVNQGGTLGGNAANTQYPAMFMKLPVTAESRFPFRFSADVMILDEGAFSDFGIFVGRLSNFSAEPDFYHVNLSVDSSLSAVYRHADHGNDHKGDRPNGPPGTADQGKAGTPTPVTGAFPTGLLTGTWYRFTAAWEPVTRKMSVSLMQNQTPKGSFTITLDGSTPNPNAPTQRLNAPPPALVGFAIGTFNDGVVMDNVVITHGAPALPRASESTIQPGNSNAHAANAGWMDLRPSASEGVVTADTFLYGRAYSANLGWIDFGSICPQNGHTYSNTAASDFGVNIGKDGSLSGNAWAANAGWIVFEQVHGKPRLDLATGVLSGHAYGVNFGWLELGSTFGQLVTRQLFRPDGDGDAISDSWEWRHFGDLGLAGSAPPTDADRDSRSDYQEYLAGSDPKNAADYFRILGQQFSAGNTSAQVRFTSSPDRLYRVQHQSDLNGAWINASPSAVQPSTGIETTATATLPGGPRRFLRVMSIQPLLPNP